ncbi:MAG: peptidase S10 [Caulobacteraceae bacterium]
MRAPAGLISGVCLAALLATAPLSAFAAPTPHTHGDQSTAATTPDDKGGDHADAKGHEIPGKVGPEDVATASVHELASRTHHSVTINGQTIAYTATAGTLTIRDDEGKPIGSMFYVAYTADHANTTHRPVTFLYNGGPGSSSMWLHMGSLAPMRIHTDSPQATRNAPFTFEPNESSLLDKSDLVFIDAMGTGYSRPLGEMKIEKFWGVDQDLDAFTRAIKRYLTVGDRWASPKFLFGESYGTTRTAGLTYMLQEQGVQLNGATILSSVLNYGRQQPGYDWPYVGYIPSYAATAWYHNLIPNKPADLSSFLAEVRQWAAGPYEAALTKGDNISPQEADAIAKQLSAYTGMPVDFIKESHLRVDLNRFRAEVLRRQGLIVGRYDSRFTGFNTDEAAESPDHDPSDTGISGAFVAAFNDYITNELNFHTDMAYRPTNYDRSLHWDFTHSAPGQRFGKQAAVDVAIDLGTAMRENPHLKLFSANGWYDLATPFFNTEYDLAHMGLPESIRSNIRFGYYPSGHMVYLNPEALKSLKADLSRFYDDATSGS